MSNPEIPNKLPDGVADFTARLEERRRDSLEADISEARELLDPNWDVQNLKPIDTESGSGTEGIAIPLFSGRSEYRKDKT